MSTLKVALFICACFTFYYESNAQESNPILAAKDLYQKKEYKKCQLLLDDLLAHRTEHADSTIAETYKMRGDIYLKDFDLKNTLRMYELSDEIYAKYKNQFVHQRLVLANKSGICYAQQDKLVETAKFFQKEYDIAIQNYGPEDLTVGKSTNNLAAVYLYLGDFEKSLDYFFKSVEIKKKFEEENPIPLANTYENISTIYAQINQMGEAEKYLLMAGHLYQKDSPKRVEALFSYYNNMATFYIENEQVKEGIEQLDLAEALPPEFKENQLGVLIHQKLYGDAYFKQEAFDQAMSCYLKTEDLIHKYDVGQKELGIIHTQMAEIYASKGEESKAVQYLQQANDEMLSLYGNTHKNYLNLIERQIYISLQMGELSLAENLKTAYKKNFLLRTESLPNDLLYTNLKMGVLSIDLSIALAAYKSSKTNKDLDIAISKADSVVLYQDELLNNISDPENRLYFFKNAYSNFSYAIFLLINKYNTSNDIKYLEKAFALSEKAKFYSMKESRGANYPILEASVPEQLRAVEKDLKLKLNQAISKYENKLDQKIVTAEMLSLVNQIDSLKALHKTALSRLSDASPALESFLTNNIDLDIEKCKAKLKSLNRIYVSYFLNEDKLLDENYAFVVSNDSLQYYIISESTSDLKSMTLDLNKALRLDLSGPGDEKIMTAFKAPASQLYDALINPLNLTEKEGLIINAHKELYSIPFEVFLTSDKESFLIQDQEVSYTYALQSLLDSYNDSYDVDVIVGAPDFSNSAELGFLPLPNSKTEIESVNSILNPSKSSEVHSKQEFQDRVSNGRINILHLATHAAANQDRGYQSYLAFGNRPSDLLYSREIYGLPIQANLVVLSGCETGDGELVKSQGVLGLTSAFASTATQSIVASLWNVNDVSSQEIMTYFYQGLKSGQAKDEALRSAKLSYLSSVPPSKKHPYYWAGFIQYGNVEPLVFNHPRPITLIVALIGLGLILFLVLWYRKNNKAASFS